MGELGGNLLPYFGYKMVEEAKGKGFSILGIQISLKISEEKKKEVEIKKVRVQVPLASASNSKVITHLVIVPKKIMKRNNTIMSPRYIMNLLWKNYMK